MNSEPGPPVLVILIGFARCKVGSRILYSTSSGSVADISLLSPVEFEELFETGAFSSISSSSTTEYPLGHVGSGSLNF